MFNLQIKCTPLLQCTLLLSSLTLFSMVSQANSPTNNPTLIPAAPQIAAKSYLLMDANTGDVIVEHNGDLQLPPASLTKMMSTYVASHELAKNNIHLNDEVRVSINAWKAEGSRMFIKEGTTVSVEQLLKGIIIQSGNDATIALAEHIAGSESAFADYMNRYASNIGMTHTHFSNATGWPAPDHVTTATDLAKLARGIINEFPDHYVWYSEKEFTYNNITQPNRNLLLWRDPSVDGIKTGHTQDAGYCLVASAKKDDMRLISVVMGTASEEARAGESQTLLTYGFRFYQTLTLLEKNKEITKTKLWMGKQNEVKLGVLDNVLATIPRGKQGLVETAFVVNKTIKAPVKTGDALGTLTLTLEGKILNTLPLVALEDVEKGNIFKQLIDYVILLFKSLF